ncbi:hypothetical protein QYE77_05695 [Thermanaerothrix sp. 4228-RoL]|uniref:Uncharacterized protein n=1 Tax=Thermanaerothrix solaris TaxID=3058434 RepID=A0ABU3NNJ6_9CHLR|nr:hypothetical protein [Thermanaerothrix sp. 4228-RoL]MDT8897753.1 hypothetical protein [Thermanaerothrix sp. 4228-RoL]
MNLLDKDWAFFQAAVPELEDYLLSPVLFWPLNLRIGYPIPEDLNRLTLGNLLLAQARLNAHPWPEPQHRQLAQLTQQVQQIREHWRANWQKKAAQEIPTRLNLWKQALAEALDPSATPSSTMWAYQVRHRAILHFLFLEIPAIEPSHREALAALDQRLRSTKPLNGFLWEPELQAAFPPETFWFLYIMP